MSSQFPESEHLIDNFIDELWLEKGLSHNTLSAYRQDISSFNKWLNINLLEVTKAELLDYLAYRLKKGYSSRSTARSLSSLRALYNQLSNKYNLKENPTAKIDSPKLGHSLPKVISEEEVEKLKKVEEYRDLFHYVTTIKGLLKNKITNHDIISSLMPGGGGLRL